jgi:hypothetical protein
MRASTPRPGTNSRWPSAHTRGAVTLPGGTPRSWNCFFRLRGKPQGCGLEALAPCRGRTIRPACSSAAGTPPCRRPARQRTPASGHGCRPGSLRSSPPAQVSPRRRRCTGASAPRDAAAVRPRALASCPHVRANQFRFSRRCTRLSGTGRAQSGAQPVHAGLRLAGWSAAARRPSAGPAVGHLPAGPSRATSVRDCVLPGRGRRLHAGTSASGKAWLSTGHTCCAAGCAHSGDRHCWVLT